VSVAEATDIARRWWRLGALVTLLIVALSLIGWLRTPPGYLASRTLTVTVLPVGTPTAQESYLAEQQALAVARSVVSSDFLSAHAFDQAVAQALPNDAESSLRAASPFALGRALSATHSGALITLTAAWGSAAAAEALATAAARVLMVGNPAVLVLFPGSSPDGAPRFTVGSATSAIEDAAVSDASRNTLLMRLALSALAGLLVIGAAELLERRTARGEMK
jgi:hypothetical protein